MVRAASFTDPTSGSACLLLTCNSKLPGQDSNLDKENQNLLCYRYTTGYKANINNNLRQSGYACFLMLSPLLSFTDSFL